MRPMPVVSPAVAARMTEAQLQATVQQVATLYGWTWHHEVDSRRSRAGFPDLVRVHPTAQRVLWVELKSAKGRVRPEQQTWLDTLNKAGQDARVWRPEHLADGTITKELKP